MKNLIRFLAKNSHWFVFLLLEIIGIILYSQFNSRQGAVIFSSVNNVAGAFYQVSSSLGTYLNLKKENSALHDENVELNMQIAQLREQLQDVGWSADTLSKCIDTTLNVRYLIKARVINNTLFRKDNFITLDKGETDGISKEMGVIDSNGIVGVIFMTSKHYSLVLPLLNSQSSINCKVAMTEFFGALSWNRESLRYACLNDLPRHSIVEKGDKIVTNGFSAVFPAGLPVGEVEEILDGDDNQSYKLKVKLGVDFANLRNVYVIDARIDEERRNLESLVK